MKKGYSKMFRMMFPWKKKKKKKKKKRKTSKCVDEGNNKRNEREGN
jgi:hypothetical protein